MSKKKLDPLKSARTKTFGSLVKAARRWSGMSQAEFGQMLGYTSGQFISAWECGTQVPPLSALKLMIGRGVTFNTVIQTIKKYRESEISIEVKSIAERLRAS